MKDSIDFIRSFPEFRNIKDSHPVRDFVEPEFDKKDSPVLNLIYAPDPVTGLPKGDYAIYLSDNTSPEVREYIRANLLRELPNAPALPDDQSDELFEYIRGTNESMSDYVARMNELMKPVEEKEG